MKMKEGGSLLDKTAGRRLFCPAERLLTAVPGRATFLWGKTKKAKNFLK